MFVQPMRIQGISSTTQYSCVIPTSAKQTRAGPAGGCDNLFGFTDRISIPAQSVFQAPKCDTAVGQGFNPARAKRNDDRKVGVAEIMMVSPVTGVPGARLVRWGGGRASENSPARQCRGMTNLS